MADRTEPVMEPTHVKHGLYLKRERTCSCGRVFTTHRRPVATYCSNACRVAYGKYGRMTYGEQQA